MVGILIGIRFRSQTERMKGFDEGFRAGKEIMLSKIELNSKYGDFIRGRKDDIQ